jgi:chemotaxis methyl-accepting protein methylase
LNDNGIFIIGYYDAMPRDYKKFFDNYDPQTKTYTKVKA